MQKQHRINIRIAKCEKKWFVLPVLVVYKKRQDSSGQFPGFIFIYLID
jgi:hypothetical protein